MKSTLIAICLTLGIVGPSSAELLLNADFEIADTGDPNFGWQTYGSAGVHDFFGGNGHGSIFTDGDQFSGVYQDVAGSAGVLYEFTLEDARIEQNAFGDLKFGIEFYSGATKLGETLGAIPAGNGTASVDNYSDSIQATALAGTDTVRVIFKLDRATGSEPDTSQSGVFVFDSTLEVVPEPASLLLIGAGALALLGRRRSSQR